MEIIPEDACSGAEEFGKEIRLELSTFEPGMQLEQSCDFDRAEKIESMLKELLENTQLDSREADRLISEDISNQAAGVLNDLSSARDGAEMMIVPEHG